MSFDIDAAGGFGSGYFNIGSLNEADNNYANREFGLWATVTAVNGNVLTLGRFIGKPGSFGGNYGMIDHVLIHHTLCKSTSPSDAVAANLGKWEVRRIISDFLCPDEGCYYDNDGNLNRIGDLPSETNYKISLDADPDIDLDNFFVQVAFIFEFENINTAITLQSVAYSYGKCQGTLETGFCGGIMAFKVSNTFTFNSEDVGDDTIVYCRINLEGGGIPKEFADYRPLMPHEKSGTGEDDTDIVSGSENSICHRRLPMNVGDGILFLLARNINFTDPGDFSGHNRPRIGNWFSEGVPYCRGSNTSPNKPSGVTNIGGSTILIASESIKNFNPKVISKYRSGSSSDGKGKGLARAYIACPYKGIEVYQSQSEALNYIPADEGLYALDFLSNNTQLYDNCKIRSFGEGTMGNCIYQLTGHVFPNRYVKISSTGTNYVIIDPNTMKFSDDTSPEFKVGALCMLHILSVRTGDIQSKVWNGRFNLCRITAINGNVIYLDNLQTVNSYNALTAAQYGQLITIPEFNDCQISSTMPGTKWENGVGGILAIACSGTLDLRGGFMNVVGCGTDREFVNELEGNQFMSCRLPIGAGHGSVFILAKNIIMDANTRIGASYSGSAYGGRAKGNGTYNYAYPGGGYHGISGSYGGGTRGGWGGGGGTDALGKSGGWHGNAPDGGGRQGAHIFIVANKITGFNLAAISTGGENATSGNGGGGAGYGGSGQAVLIDESRGGGGGYQGGGSGGGYNGSIYLGGGSAGACFIYCNEYENFTGTNINLV